MLNGFKIIAVCLSQVYIPVNHQFTSELNDILTRSGYRLFIYNTCCDLYNNDDDYNPEAVVYDLIDYDVTDAMIILEQDIKNAGVVDKLCVNAHAHDIPVIMIDGNRQDCFNLSYDYEGGFEMIVRHVIEDHKIKNPHFMAGVKDNEFSEKRLDVFKKVIAENGIPFDQSMVSYGDFWAEPARREAQKIVDSGNIPEAVICANDVMALNVINVFKSNGLSVPEDILVTGFDGVMEAFYSVPRLTTAMCSSRSLADKAAEMLEDLFAGKELPRHSYVGIVPVLSESCGCSKLSEHILADYLNDLSNHFYTFQEDYRQLSTMGEVMQGCDDISMLPKIFRENTIWGLACFLFPSCTDRSVNFISEPTIEKFGDEMFLLYNDIEGYDFTQRIFPRKDVMPRLENVFERKVPLVFNVISFMQKPIGYICFYFNSMNIVHYGKIQHTMLMFGIGIGGFISMQYQRYLADMVEENYRTDNLTGLYNRRGFSRLFEKLCSKVSLRGGILTVLLADMDGLKRINDTFGHNAGDTAIAQTARALKAACSEDALCVRFGGDEMLAVMEGNRDESELRRKYNDYLDSYNQSAGNPYTVSASLGIYKTSPGESLDFENLIKKSDELMYIEKQQKKNRRMN